MLLALVGSFAMPYLMTMRWNALIASVLITLPQAPALAHPHIFVEAEVTVIYDGAIPTAVQLNWIYDDYFSLLITTDLGIDLDGDMILSAEEELVLSSAVTAWPPDFNGDLAISQANVPVKFGDKIEHRMELRDGIVHEIHTRPLIQATDAPLTLRVYDPFYYVAYQLAGPVQIIGRTDCTSQVTPPDLNSAYSLVEELLYGRPASDVGPDEEFPEVGVEFAETVQITCES